MIDDLMSTPDAPEVWSQSEGLTDDDILKAVREEVDWATDAFEQRRGDWSRAFQYYEGKLPAPPEDGDSETAVGLSDAVSQDVADAVDSVLAEVLPAFTQAAPVEFLPLGEEDEKQAQDETDAVAHIANTCGVYMALNQAARDALLRRAGVAKVWFEARKEVAYEDVQGVPLMHVEQLLQPQSQDETVDVLRGETDGMFGSGQIRRTRVVRSPRIDAVPLDELLIAANAANPDADDVRFIAHQRLMSRSELVELGADPEQVEGLRAEEDVTKERTRDRLRDYSETELKAGHRSTEVVMVVEAYYRIDQDGDGIAERLQVITAGGSDGTDELIRITPWKDQPFCIGIPYLGNYTWDGFSLFDKLKSIQDLKSELLRDMRNLLRRAVRQRIGVVEDDADIGDVLNSVLGGVVRMRTPNGIFPIQEAAMPPAAFDMLGYLDKQRADQGGAAIDRASQTMPVGADTAHGLERMMSAQESRNAMVARNLAETLMKPIYRKLHALLRQYWQDPLTLPGSAGWRTLTPSQWPERKDMAISMGMSVGERGRRIASLQAVLQQHAQDAQTGMTGILSDLNAIYAARTDLVRLGGLPNPEQYFVDPASQQAQQAQQAMQQQAMEAQRAQMQQAQQQLEFQYRLLSDLERIKAESKLQAQQMQEQSKAMAEQLRMAERMFGHRVDLAKAQGDWNQREAQRDVDRLQAEARRTT